MYLISTSILGVISLEIKKIDILLIFHQYSFTIHTDP